MLTLLFTFLMMAVFGRLLGVAIRMSWGIIRVSFSLIMLPLGLIFLFAAGAVYIAFPVLAVIGLASLVSNKGCNS